MSREPKGQRDNSQGRIGITAGGKYRAAGDEEIRHAMHPAIGIDNAVPGIVVHPGSAQEVMRALSATIAERSLAVGCEPIRPECSGWIAQR